ncbi:hypothetical protein BKA80DRAFT_271034, partial [Phyllosticta citrichinensis]
MHISRLFLFLFVFLFLFLSLFLFLFLFALPWLVGLAACLQLLPSNRVDVQPQCYSCATGGTTLLSLSTQRHHRVSGPAKTQKKMSRLARLPVPLLSPSPQSALPRENPQEDKATRKTNQTIPLCSYARHLSHRCRLRALDPPKTPSHSAAAL